MDSVMPLLLSLIVISGVGPVLGPATGGCVGVALS